MSLSMSLKKSDHADAIVIAKHCQYVDLDIFFSSFNSGHGNTGDGFHFFGGDALLLSHRFEFSTDVVQEWIVCIIHGDAE
jgi:hypothetical protein